MSKSPRKPPPDAAGLVQSNVRMPKKLLDELDAALEEMNAGEGWQRYTRSDLVREAVSEFLERRRASPRLSSPPVQAPAERVVEYEEGAPRRKR